MNKVEKNAIRVTSNTLNETISLITDDEQLILDHTPMEYSQLNLTIEMMDDLAGVLDSYRTENCIDE